MSPRGKLRMSSTAFPATAWAEGPQLNAAPSPQRSASCDPKRRGKGPRTTRGCFPAHTLTDVEMRETRIERRQGMALVKWEPSEGLATLQREMNRLLESYFGGSPWRFDESM